jgi:DNA replication protein DnaC
MNPTILEQIKQDLRRLYLGDMAHVLEEILEAAQTERQGHLDFLSRLVAVQLQARQARSLQNRIRKAGFPQNMTFESFDWNFQPGLNVEHLKDLQHLAFISQHQPLLIVGKTGTGKSHLAASFGIRACEAGFKVQFFKLQKLLSLLYATLADDSTDMLLAKLTRLHLLIIDAMDHLRTKPEYPSLLLELVSACQNRTALLVTSRISFQDLGVVLGNPSITHAILDRLFHRAIVINIHQGRSYRTEGPHAPRQLKDFPHAPGD